MSFYQITDLIIYPIKSLGGIHLKEAVVEAMGLQHDRRWMLVDENNRFISQREVPQMCLLKLQMRETGFFIYHQHNTSQHLFLPFDSNSQQVVQVKVWDHELQAVFVGEDYDDWFSHQLGVKCRLVKAENFTHRKVNPVYALNGEQTVFADGYPVLVIGEESLADLNQRLDSPVPMDRFRPNLVFSGGQAFDEDHWSEIQTTDVVLKPVKPCDRCTVTTINQHTAVGGKEPLKTLTTYRTKDNKVLFGQNALVLQPGILKIGEQLVIKPKIN